MADQTHRTWDGAGFGDEDEGFMKTEREASQARRLVPPPSQVPPPKPPQRSGRGTTGILIGVLVAAILVLGGIIVWRTFVDMTPNDTESTIVTGDDETSTVSERVDTGIVVRQEQSKSASTMEPADVAAADTKREGVQPPTPTAASATRPATPVASVPSSTDAPATTKPVTDPATVNEDRSATKPPAVSSPAPVNVPAAKVRPSMAITPAPKGTPVYVVQVFSSPARDDAEEWMQILRSRNVRDAFISEQRIKGETWYRVRFGQFSKRQDAEHAALKVGVDQPWIARIK